MTLARAFAALLEDWPELAAFVGARPPTARLSSLSPELAHERIAALHALALTADDPHDAQLLTRQAELFEAVFQLGRWRANPDVLSEWSALLVRQALDAAHEPDEAARLSGWLASMAAALPGGQIDRHAPDPRALELAREVGLGFAEQVDALEPLVERSALRSAQSALRAHLAWLHGLTPGPELGPLGRETCERWLSLRALPFTPQALLAAADEALDQGPSRESPGRSTAHPATFEGLLQTLRGQLDSSRRAWLATGLPDAAVTFDVLQTPAALVPGIPMGAAFTPRPLRPDEHGLIVITPPRDLAERSLAHLANLAVHEGAPGHGLQADRANRAGRPWRAVDLCPLPGAGAGLFAGELMEGWPHFAEERFAEHLASHERGGQRAESVWRAARARVDLGVALGELDTRQAARFLVERAGLSAEAARAEVDDFRLNPTYGLSYLAGKLQLRALRSGWTGDEAALYEAILAEGLAPLAWGGRWAKEALSAADR